MSVTHQFENDIRYNVERYATKLRFRPDHDWLPDNFKVSENRLEKNNLLKDYGNIFKDYEANNIIQRVHE